MQNLLFVLSMLIISHILCLGNIILFANLFILLHSWSLDLVDVEFVTVNEGSSLCNS